MIEDFTHIAYLLSPLISKFCFFINHLYKVYQIIRSQTSVSTDYIHYSSLNQRLHLQNTIACYPSEITLYLQLRIVEA